MKIYELLEDLKDWLEVKVTGHDSDRWRQANILDNPYREVLNKIEELEYLYE